MGIASNNPVSVRAIGFTTIAHQMHHQKYFKKGIYKLLEASGPIFNLFSKTLYWEGLKDHVIGDAFYLSKFFEIPMTFLSVKMI
jgi:hypothetical protein